MDKNLFRDSQLISGKNRWELRCQSRTSGDDSNGVPTNGPNWDTVLLAGIISDTEVGMSVSNSFDVNKSGLAGKLSEVVGKANQLIDTANANVTLLQNATQNLADVIGDTLGEGWVTDALGGLADGVDKIQEWLAGKLPGVDSTNLLNSQIVVGTDYVKMFRASTPTYDIPSINTVFYHGDHYSDDDPGDGLVLDKLDELIDRFVAKYHVLSGDIAPDANEASNPSNPGDEGGILGIMFAPNNYKADFKNIGNEVSIDGTFELRYGDHIYRNLLVTSFSFKLSTFKALGLNGVPTKSPLYAEIQVSFEPCTLLTNKNMKRFIRYQ